MFDLDTKEIVKLESTLLSLTTRAIPYAARSALNSVAYKAQWQSKNIISRTMVERNKFTSGSIRVNTARGYHVDRMEAEIGSMQGYMETQEFSGVKRPKGKHGVPIPTSAAAGQPGARPRTKLPSRGNKMSGIKLARFKALGKTPNQRLVVAMNMAVKRKKRHVFLSVGKHKQRKGIYKVSGGRYRGRGWPGNAKLNMVWDMSHHYVRIPSTPWLRPAVNIAMLSMQSEYEKALIYQIKRARTFG